MKKIVLTPVKNEAWILQQSLENFSAFADHILIADQGSTDGSTEIYKKFPKVTVIENKESGHNNSVRWLLLDSARKIFNTLDKNEPTIIFCLDADEMISKDTANLIHKLSEDHLNRNPDKTISFELPWIQLWKDIHHYRNDGVWLNNFKNIVFIDNVHLDYIRSLTINDHTSRIPNTSEIIKLPDNPLLHFQFIAWESSQIKQAWYMASELISGQFSARRINHKYEGSLQKNAVVIETPTEWINSIPEAQSVIPPKETTKIWQFEKLIGWFDNFGLEYFEHLNIWHSDLLHAMFIKKKGRNPKPKFYPRILVKINGLKNIIKKCLKKYT